ncbi:hypothetical protein [Ekhidna sp. To15]|uniref:hypothetical protein n=1 Tax=Ekhidna sp. To15 TaxID=3395267 RepID=UPI003F51ECF6
MKKNKLSTKEIITFILSFGAIAISIISSFGIVDLGEFESQVPNLILGLIGLLIINATLERKNDLKNLENKIDKIISLTSDDNLKKLQHLTDDIQPTLKVIFGDFIKEFSSFFKDAIQSERIEFYDLERFKTSYIRTLQYKEKDNTTFLATSLPYKRYFWVNDEDISPILKAMKNFKINGSRFIRIFFLEENDLKNQEVIDVLNAQLDLEIEVYTIPIDQVPRRLQNYFVVDDQNDLAWEVTIDTKQRINSTAFTTSSTEIEKYKSIFEGLMNLDNIKKISSKLSLVDSKKG